MSRASFFSLFILIWSGGVFAQQNSFDRGARYYHRSDFEKAAKVYEEAAKSYADPRFRYNLGNTLFRLGNTADALKQYQLVNRESRDSGFRAMAMFNTGVVLQHTGAIHEAVAAYRKALLLAPQDTAIRKNLQLLMTTLARNQSSTPPPPSKKQPDLQSLRTRETDLQKKLIKKQSSPATEKDW